MAPRRPCQQKKSLEKFKTYIFFRATCLHQPLLGVVAPVELEGEDVLHELVDVARLGHDLEVVPVVEAAVVEADQEVAGHVGVRLLQSVSDKGTSKIDTDIRTGNH